MCSRALAQLLCLTITTKNVTLRICRVLSSSIVVAVSSHPAPNTQSPTRAPRAQAYAFPLSHFSPRWGLFSCLVFVLFWIAFLHLGRKQPKPPTVSLPAVYLDASPISLHICARFASFLFGNLNFIAILMQRKENKQKPRQETERAEIFWLTWRNLPTKYAL